MWMTFSVLWQVVRLDLLDFLFLFFDWNKPEQLRSNATISDMRIQVNSRMVQPKYFPTQVVVLGAIGRNSLGGTVFHVK